MLCLFLVKKAVISLDDLGKKGSGSNMKYLGLSLGLYLAFFGLVAGVYADTIDLDAVDSNELRSTDPNSASFGGNLYYSYPSFDSRVLLRFPLPDLSLSGTITDVTLHWRNNCSSGDTEQDIHEFTYDNWTSSATWNKYDGSSSWVGGAGGSAYVGSLLKHSVLSGSIDNVVFDYSLGAVGDFDENLNLEVDKSGGSNSNCMQGHLGGYVPHITITYTPGDPDVILGCMDPIASNYDPEATEEDGSCIYVPADFSYLITRTATTTCDALGSSTQCITEYIPEITAGDWRYVMALQVIALYMLVWGIIYSPFKGRSK